MRRTAAMLACVVLAIALALAPRAAEAGIIYGATAAGSAGELYVLNPNGTVAHDVGPLNDASGLNYGMTGLAFHPQTGVLYGATHNFTEANPATLARLVTIDPATARVTVVGAFNAGNAGRPATMTDLAFDAAGNLYGVGSVGGPQLYSINTATGKATVIGSTGLTSTTGGGLAFGPTGILFGTPTASRFGTYNVATGAFTNIADPVEPVGGAYAALEFDETGLLFALNLGSGTPPTTHLVTILPATGVITDLGASVNSLDAIAVFVPEPAAAAALLLAGAMTIRRTGRAR